MVPRQFALSAGFRPILLLSLFLVSVRAGAQTLDGVIDIHAHADPDSVARSIDALDLARLAESVLSS